MTKKIKPHILFICTGNACRSPMAEYLLRRHLGPHAPWRISSAGISAVSGLTASETAIEVLREKGVDLASHRSRSVNQELVDAATMIVVMTTAHVREMKTRFPEAAGRVFLLKSFGAASGGEDVADPLGGTAETYRRIRDEIDEALLDLILYLRRCGAEKESQ